MPSAPWPAVRHVIILLDPPELARLGISRLPRSALKFCAGHRGITDLMTSMRFGKEFTRRRPIERRNIIRTRQEDDELVPVNLDDHAPRQRSQRQPFPICYNERTGRRSAASDRHLPKATQARLGLR